MGRRDDGSVRRALTWVRDNDVLSLGGAKHVLRRVLLAASRSHRLEELARSVPPARNLVARYVAGEGVRDAVRSSRELREDGLYVSLDHLGEDTRDVGQAEATAKHYVELLHRLSDAGLTGASEVSVKLSALGLMLDAGGERVARDNAGAICEAARVVGTTVTLDMEDHTTVDSTLAVLTELRETYPDVGAVIQAQLRRSESDCAALAYPGSRVRLCKGAYAAPESVAFVAGHEVDKSYIRCLATLMAAGGYPMVATHDPRLVEIAAALAALGDREGDTFEYQMLYGIRPDEQRRLARSGARVRVYLPYGDQWYPYLVRRLAERPANVAFFLRSLTSKS